MKPIDGKALENMLIKRLPREKVILIIKEEPAESISDVKETDALYAPLREAGIRPETGLRFCHGDDAFYRSLLRDFAGSAEKKAADMEQNCSLMKWEDYAILVHALKSTSRTIGAESLSEMAAALEEAANRGDVDAILEKHPDTLRMYESIVKAIRSALGKGEEPVDSEEEILEFFLD